MTSIEYEDYELLSFFENEPEYLLDYAIEKDGFKLYLNLAVYQQEVDVSIEYQGKLVMAQTLRDVTRVRLNGEWLEIITGCRKSYFLKKEPILAFVEGMAESNA